MNHLMTWRGPWFTLGLLLLVFLMTTCKRAPVPIPNSPKDKVLILFIGGFQTNQLHDIYNYIHEQVPGASLAWFSEQDCFKTDVQAYCNGSSYDKLVLIGHSWGCARITEDSAKVNTKVDLVVFYDPVDFGLGPKLELPGNVKKALVFPRLGLAPMQTAKIVGIGDVTVLPQPGGHSDGCHNPETFETVGTYLKEML